MVRKSKRTPKDIIAEREATRVKRPMTDEDVYAIIAEHCPNIKAEYAESVDFPATVFDALLAFVAALNADNRDDFAIKERKLKAILLEFGDATSLDEAFKDIQKQTLSTPQKPPRKAAPKRESGDGDLDAILALLKTEREKEQGVAPAGKRTIASIDNQHALIRRMRNAVGETLEKMAGEQPQESPDRPAIAKLAADFKGERTLGPALDDLMMILSQASVANTTLSTNDLDSIYKSSIKALKKTITADMAADVLDVIQESANEAAISRAAGRRA